VTRLRIGTRGSALALWQANTVAGLITERGGPICEIVVIRTSGDEARGPRVPQVQSTKSSFVKEIEDALLDGHVDLAVHSSKDLSAVLPDRLIIGATLARDDPRDAVLLPHGERIDTRDALRTRIGSACVIGTSSVRRVAQLSTIFPQASFVPIRGNVDTRLRKLDAGECDVLILACAGLKRLELDHRISFALPADDCIPAPGQGIVAIQVREDRADVGRVVAAVSDAAAMDALMAERAVVRALGGGCQMPLGAYAYIDGNALALDAVVISPDGSRALREHAKGPRNDAASIGGAVAQSLIASGAERILRGSDGSGPTDGSRGSTIRRADPK
jgi:hydroxymethylbilane synthase